MKAIWIIAGAALLGLAAQTAAASGDAEAGKAKAAQVCAACHGPRGEKPTTPEYPILAGQYPDYIVQALSDYKSGKRSNPIMKGMAAGLTEQDMENVAAWFSSQPSPLHTQY